MVETFASKNSLWQSNELSSSCQGESRAMSHQFNKFLFFMLIFIGLSAWAYTLSDFKKTAAENTSLRLMQRESQGKAFPSLEVENHDGKTISLASLDAEYMLINFWATWCPPCIKEMPDLDRLQSYFEPNFLKIVPISVDQQKSLAIVFYAEQGFQNLKLYYDADKMAMSEKLITGLPVTYLVDRNFKIHARLEGITKWDHPDVIKDLKEIMGAK